MVAQCAVQVVVQMSQGLALGQSAVPELEQDAQTQLQRQLQTPGLPPAGLAPPVCAELPPDPTALVPPLGEAPPVGTPNPVVPPLPPVPPQASDQTSHVGSVPACFSGTQPDDIIPLNQ